MLMLVLLLPTSSETLLFCSVKRWARGVNSEKREERTTPLGFVSQQSGRDLSWETEISIDEGDNT